MPLKTVIFAFVTAVLSLTGILLVSEGGLWLASKLLPGQELSMFRSKPGGSYELIPNLKFDTMADGRPVNITINSHGMRWK